MSVADKDHDCLTAIQLNQLLQGTLGELEEAALERHIESCANCQQRIERLAVGQRTSDELAKRLRQAGDFSPALRQAIDDCAGDDPLTRCERPSLRDQPTLPPRPRGKLPTHIGEYEVLDLIGKGGMGLVLKCRDPKLNRIVAIKLLSPRMSDDETCRQRFLREARAAAAINQPNVVTIYAVVDRESDAPDALGPYIVMEFVNGPSLREYMEQHGSLTPKQVAQLGVQIAQGLAAAHARGVIHRDIKPANIVMDLQSGRVKLTDFGLARLDDDVTLTRTGVIAGTPAFMSPEQALGKPLDHRSDLFSLGSVLYVLCSGQLPFEQTETQTVVERVLSDDPQSLAEVSPQMPNELSEIIRRLHAKDPNHRIDSALEVVRGLKQLVKRLDRDGWGKGPALSKSVTKAPLTQVDHARATTSIETVIEPGATGLSGGRQKRGFVVGISIVVALSILMAGWLFSRDSDQATPPTEPKADAEVDAWLARNLGEAPSPQHPQDFRFRLTTHGDQQFHTLEDAVRAIVESPQDEATLEVTSSVPIPFVPVTFQRKRVTIKAAPGERPVLRSHVQGDVPLIDVESDLVLQGIEIQHLAADNVFQNGPGFLPFSTTIRVRNGRLRAANCRFAITLPARCFEVRGGNGIDLINCEIHSALGAGAELFLDADDADVTAKFENCIMRCGRIAELKRLSLNRSGQVLMSRNTMICERLFELMDLPNQGPATGSRPWNVRAFDNLIHANTAVLAFRGGVPIRANDDANAEPLRPLFPRFLFWAGNRNHYSGKGHWIVRQARNELPQPPPRAPVTLEEWQSVWLNHDKNSRHMPGKFLHPEVTSIVGARQLFDSPEAFMTQADEQLAVGANLSDIGPGPAYFQWINTTAAQEWFRQ